MEKKTTMYKQGDGWVVSRWDERVKCYRVSQEMPYGQARVAVGSDNCRNPLTCDKITHDHNDEMKGEIK